MLKEYTKLSDMVEAIKTGEIPADVVSPGSAAQLMGITRQAINERMYHTQSLDVWKADGIVLVGIESIKRALKKKSGIPDTQGELPI